MITRARFFVWVCALVVSACGAFAADDLAVTLVYATSGRMNQARGAAGNEVRLDEKLTFILEEKILLEKE